MQHFRKQYDIKVHVYKLVLFLPLLIYKNVKNKYGTKEKETELYIFLEKQGEGGKKNVLQLLRYGFSV